MTDDPIALYFVPTDEGQHVIGIPARDLTAAEVEEIKAREPAAFRNATVPGPNGHALYQPSKPTGKRAEQAEANKTAIPVDADQPDAPAKE